MKIISNHPYLNRTLKATAILATLALSACSTMNREECLHADWQLIGHQDAIEGNAQNRLSYYRTDCAEFGVAPDLVEYQKGFDKGLDSFCTYESGKNFGINGGDYQATCQSHANAGAFQEGYNVGNGYYSLQSRHGQLTYEQESIKHTIDKTKKRMGTKELELISDYTTAERRLILLVEIKDTQAEIGALEKTYIDNQMAIGSLSNQIATYWQNK